MGWKVNGMNSCRTFHFLAKTHVDRTGQESRVTWDEGERQTGVVAEYYAAECAQGIWSMRIDPSFTAKARIGDQSQARLLL